MAPIEIELKPVDHITTDALGQPGKRVFYIQARKGVETVTVIVEKIQIQTLAEGYEQFLAEVKERFPDLPDASGDYDEAQMHIAPPVDPVFRVGEMGLGFEAESDLTVLLMRELLAEDQAPEEAGSVRLWCTRSQLRAMCHWGVEVAARGRPICPQCGEPIEPEGHFCPKKNGHKH